ncbi:MAG: hypothetical protein KatS3mg056_1038 [Chloroflexus sp.]|nr:MAG: hypothetical protein KatS3mg056_1038 [Chloroflexus sp.]
MMSVPERGTGEPALPLLGSGTRIAARIPLPESVARGVWCGVRQPHCRASRAHDQGWGAAAFPHGHGDDVRAEQVCQVWLTACEWWCGSWRRRPACRPWCR